LGGEGAATEPALGLLHVPGRDGRREKMVNKYAAIVYIRLNASMNKQKKKDYGGALENPYAVYRPPRAQWQQPNTPARKFVKGAPEMTKEIAPKTEERKEPHPRHISSARQRKTQSEPQCQEPVGHCPPGSSSSSLNTPAAATARSSSSSSLSQFSSTGGAARPT